MLASLAACGCGKEAVTAQTFADACQKLLQTSCERYTDCLAPTRTDPSKTRDDYIRECIADNERTDGTCQDRYQKAECRQEEQDAYVTCEREVRGAQCSALCTGTDSGFCWHPCGYFCPPKN